MTTDNNNKDSKQNCDKQVEKNETPSFEDSASDHGADTSDANTTQANSPSDSVVATYGSSFETSDQDTDGERLRGVKEHSAISKQGTKDYVDKNDHIIHRIDGHNSNIQKELDDFEEGYKQN